VTSLSHHIQGIDSTNGAFPLLRDILDTHIEDDERHLFPHTAGKYNQGSDHHLI